MIKYRPEIDGLRTIAVLAVILYHAEFLILNRPVMRGGFLGVDIFFVISGYLITSIILKEIESQQFSLRRFYERRVRRLLPALFTVIAVSLPFAIWLMSAPALKEYAGSVLSSMLFSSNIWFWMEDSYVAEPSRLKPFLHTWTLSVEEQFYIVFPLAVLLLWRLKRAYLLGALVLSFLVSLQLSQVLSTRLPDANFFLLPTRVWELMAGATMAKLELDHGRRTHPALTATLPTVGLAMIGWSLLTYSDSMLHPGYVTLLPVIGTVLIIWFAAPGEPVGDLLRLRPMVWLGLISYSLYLWHYPIFAFARTLLWDPGPVMMTGLIGLSGVASIATYRFVETPFRDRERVSIKALALILLPVAALLMAINLGIYLKDGQLRSEANLSYRTGDIEAGKAARFDSLERRCNAINCQSPQSDQFNVLIVGDSHTVDALNALDAVYPAAHFILSEQGGCPPHPDIRPHVSATHPNLAQCEQLNTQRFTPASYAGIDMVVISYFGDWFGGPDIEPYLAFLHDQVDVPVLWIGNYIGLSTNFPDILNAPEGIDGLTPHIRSRFAFEAENQVLATRYDVTYLSKQDALCDGEACPYFIDSIPFSWDRHHLSVEFARYFGQQIADDIRPYFPEE